MLIVEDEATVASAMKKIIELGLSEHRTECHCVDGSACLKLLESGAVFDAILCDLNLKESSGRFIYETIVKDHPTFCNCFAFLTGDSHRAEAINFLRSTGRPYLLKPFEPEQLLTLVTDLASGSGAAD